MLIETFYGKTKCPISQISKIRRFWDLVLAEINFSYKELEILCFVSSKFYLCNIFYQKMGYCEEMGTLF